jgi:hypothetical protein
MLENKTERIPTTSKKEFMSQENDLRNLIVIRQRRLQKLKEKEASFGLNTPVDILTEIEDIETEIENLQGELQRAEKVTDIKSNTAKAIEELSTPKEIKSPYRWLTISSFKKPWLIFGIGAVFLVSLLAIGYVAQFYKYSKVAPAFIPVKIGLGQSNANIDFYEASKPDLPNTLSWYKYKSGTLSPSSPIEIGHLQIDRYLYYSSTLNTDISWTSIAFWRIYIIPILGLNILELNASNSTELIAIIYAEEPDGLEIGFKDMHENERKIGLNVVKGWAGYRVPLDEFHRVDFNRIQLFIIAHTRYLAKNEANVFKLALLDLK